MTGRSERLCLSHHALAEEILKEERRALRVGIGSARTPLGGFLLRGWISLSGRGLRRFRGSVIGYRRSCAPRIGNCRLHVERAAAWPDEIIGPSSGSAGRLALVEHARAGCVEGGGAGAPAADQLLRRHLHR